MARWIVTFDGGAEGRDGDGVAMRGLLKVALRRFGMRCVEVRREEREMGPREVLAEAVKRELAAKVTRKDHVTFECHGR